MLPVTAGRRQSLLATLSVCDSGVIFTLYVAGRFSLSLPHFGSTVIKATVSVIIFADVFTFNQFRIISQ